MRSTRTGRRLKKWKFFIKPRVLIPAGALQRSCIKIFGFHYEIEILESIFGFRYEIEILDSIFGFHYEIEILESIISTL
jgi:hypothetical protein